MKLQLKTFMACLLLGAFVPLFSWAQLSLYDKTISYELRLNGDVDVYEHWSFLTDSDQFETELALPLLQGDGRDYKSFFTMYDSQGRMTRDSTWTEGRSRDKVAGHYALLKSDDGQLVLHFGVPAKGKKEDSKLRIFSVGYTMRAKVEQFENGPAFRFSYENIEPWTPGSTKIEFKLKNESKLSPEGTAIWWHVTGYASTRVEEKDGKMSVVCSTADDNPIRMEGLVLMKPGQTGTAKYGQGIVKPAENMVSLTPKCATAPMEPEKENPLPRILTIVGIVAALLIGIYVLSHEARRRNWLGQNDIYDMKRDADRE